MNPKDTATILLAHKLYDIYCEAVGGKAYDNKPLPTAEEFFNDPSKEKQQKGWIAVAKAVVDK